MHKSLHEFEIGPDLTTGFHGISVIIMKTVLPLFLVVLNGILFILTGNDDIHKSLDEFEFQPDPATDHIASCP